MKKELYLHVGMDKTGTSAIQKFIFENKHRFFRDTGVYYPSTGLWKDYSHHPFAFSIFEMNGYRRKHLLKLCQKLVKETESYNKILLSSECLFKAPLKENFELFYNNIRAYFEKIKIIVYLRRQDHWVESRHKHSILSGNEIPLEVLQRPFFCNYKQYIDAWRDVVGERNNIVVRIYERQQFVGGNIFSDFIDVFEGGLTLDGYLVPGKEINQSLGPCEIEFKRLCNYLEKFSGADKLNAILIDFARIHGVENNLRLLSPQERQSLLSRCEPWNAALAKEYLGRMDGELFREGSPSPNDPWLADRDLPNNKIVEIAKFIKSCDRNLFKSLCKAIKYGNIANDKRVQFAAAKLRPCLGVGIEQASY